MTLDLSIEDPFEQQTYRDVVIACLPRVIRVGVSNVDVRDPLFDALATEIEAMRPDLLGRYRAAVADARHYNLRELRGIDPLCLPSMNDVVARLDETASTQPMATELGCMLLLVFGDPADARACARLTASCRAALGGITARSIAAELAAKADLGPIGDWRRILTLAAGYDAEIGRRAREEGAGKEDLSAIDGSLARARQIEAWREAADDVLQSCRALIVGLACMSAGEAANGYSETVAEHARAIGQKILRDTERLANDRVVARYSRLLDAEREKSKVVAAKAESEAPAPAETTAAGHVVVCPNIHDGAKLKDVVATYKKVLGKPLPLVPVPDLAVAAALLAAEFPHCVEMTDTLMRQLAGKPFVTLRPLLFKGNPGSGKSRYVRRLGEILGVGVYRVDGSGDAGVSFAGTERRWYSTEPCRPFMACARHQQANPMIFVDEIDKAPVRNEYGRLWDGMLSFMETETASRFQDPCLQVEIDVGHVLIVATANDASKLPGPLLDRFGIIVDFPDPVARHLEPLAAALARDLAMRQGMDPRFVEPFDEIELRAMRRLWSGGSVRRLGRIVAAVVRAQDGRRAGLLQ